MPTGEIQTDAIVRDALSSGKQVFVPYLHRNPAQSPDTPTRVMDMVHLKSIQDYESLQYDRWNIPSIDPSTVHERQHILGGSINKASESALLDLVLLPGVAFDVDERTGAVRRLGHGKGFYDFFLNRYSSKYAAQEGGGKSPVLLYGLALTEQFLTAPDDSVPVGQFDRQLHGLILGDGGIKASSGSRTDA
jgi:5-formyltetrahydrofolate cyclo-ligase